MAEVQELTYLNIKHMYVIPSGFALVFISVQDCTSQCLVLKNTHVFVASDILFLDIKMKQTITMHMVSTIYYNTHVATVTLFTHTHTQTCTSMHTHVHAHLCTLAGSGTGSQPDGCFLIGNIGEEREKGERECVIIEVSALKPSEL